MKEFLWLLIHDQGLKNFTPIYTKKITDISNSWVWKWDKTRRHEGCRTEESLPDTPEARDNQKLHNLIYDAVFKFSEIELANNQDKLRKWERLIKKESALEWVATNKKTSYLLRHFPKNKTDYLDEMVKAYEREQKAGEATKRSKTKPSNKTIPGKEAAFKKKFLAKAAQVLKHNPQLTVPKIIETQWYKDILEQARVEGLPENKPAYKQLQKLMREARKKAGVKYRP